jgi:CBS domain-containing protein
MNVKEVMSRDIRSVRMVDRLDAAARVMWEHDCGVVPVVDGNQAIVGIVTDRDLCMASYTQGRVLAEIPVTAVMARSVRTCKPDDALTTALATMQRHQLHRLPVVDARGVVVGMVATNDVVRLAHARPAVVAATVIVETLATIGAPRRAATSGTAATSAANAPTATPTATATAATAANVAPAPASRAAAASAPAPVAIPAATLVPSGGGKHDKGKNAKSKGKKG